MKITLLILLCGFQLTAQVVRIPNSYFGQHDTGSTSTFPLPISYGNFRFWDSGPNVQWQGMHVCNSTTANCLANPATYTSLTTSGSGAYLDNVLANLYSSGVNDVLYTGGRVPSWAAGATSYSPACIYGNGTCVLPAEMSVDGSCSGTIGSNTAACSIWDTFWHLLAVHANNSTFLQTHAHIKYWEPWNEWFEDNLVSASVSSTEVNATYAQMLRMTEDMRCLIKGVGTIHNYPASGSSASCSSYLSALGWSAADPAALIVAPDGNPTLTPQFLYCTYSPLNDNGSSTTCTWPPSGGNTANCNSSSCWGSQAVDVIADHFYYSQYTPEIMVGSTGQVTQLKGRLSTTDSAKMLMCGECSGGFPATGPNIWNDNYSEAASVARGLALYWSAGITNFQWYAYNGSDQLGSDSGVLTPAGIAWNTDVKWLRGATPAGSPFCTNSGTVYTCKLIEANGLRGLLVWDSQYGPGGTSSPSNCTTAATPTICGSTSYSVPTGYSTDWLDMIGTKHSFTSTITIGAVPILVEGTGMAVDPDIQVF